jgi:hypothetical protein
MPGLVPASTYSLARRKKDVDGRDKPAMTANSPALAVAADCAMPICAPRGETRPYLIASRMV